MQEKTKHEAMLALSEKHGRLEEEYKDSATTWKRQGEIVKELKAVTKAFGDIKKLDSIT